MSNWSPADPSQWQSGCYVASASVVVPPGGISDFSAAFPRDVGGIVQLPANAGSVDIGHVGQSYLSTYAGDAPAGAGFFAAPGSTDLNGSYTYAMADLAPGETATAWIVRCPADGASPDSSAPAFASGRLSSATVTEASLASHQVVDGAFSPMVPEIGLAATACILISVGLFGTNQIYRFARRLVGL